MSEGGRDILSQAERCVKCAYCLPHCPTYRLSQNEADSPRGRIALVRALADGSLEGMGVWRHLDRCLGCLACERACPLKLPYGLMIEAAWRWHADAMPGWRRLLHRLLRRGLVQLPGSTATQRLLHLGWGPLRWTLSRLSGRLGGLMPPTPPLPPRWGCYPPAGAVRGRVALFTGCISRVTDAAALNGSLRVLNRLGYEVVIPRQQVCCGAMDRRSGDCRQEGRLTGKNLTVFAEAAVDRVLVVASGCAARLRDYPAPLGGQVEEITAFVAAAEGWAGLQLRPLAQRVAVHTPCTQRGVPGVAEAVFALLSRIPSIDLHPLPDSGECCGGAGLYLLTQPRLSEQLAQRKVETLRGDPPEMLITSNTGCALQLGAATRGAKLGVRVLHPMELLAEQLDEYTT